jgi:AcrR family transcriptional regulator
VTVAEAIRDEVGRQGGHVVEMQRHRLLSAMVEVLAEHGLEEARVGRVCARAGVSRRTFYDLFEDRDSCLVAACDMAVEQLRGTVVSAYEREGRWRERVRSALTVLLESFDQEPDLARLCVVEALKGGPSVQERRRAVLEELTAVVDAGRLEARGGSDASRLTAESVVGGAISVIHTRLIERDPRPLVELVNPLMGMIVLPYLGLAASRKELARATPVAAGTGASARRTPSPVHDPFKDLPIRITFRTVRVLSTIADRPSASNREIAEFAGVRDQGQMSKLLRRIEKAGLIDNQSEGQARGEANAWRLTDRGRGILRAVGDSPVA